MASSSEQLDFRTRIAELVRDCGPDGNSTLLIQWRGGNPTASGRTDYYTVFVADVVDGRPTIGADITYHYAKCGLGGRYSGSRGAVGIGGFGENKSLVIARSIALMAGHPVWCNGEFMPQWVGADIGGGNE